MGKRSPPVHKTKATHSDAWNRIAVRLPGCRLGPQQFRAAEDQATSCAGTATFDAAVSSLQTLYALDVHSRKAAWALLARLTTRLRARLS